MEAVGKRQYVRYTMYTIKISFSEMPSSCYGKKIHNDSTSYHADLDSGNSIHTSKGHMYVFTIYSILHSS